MLLFLGWAGTCGEASRGAGKEGKLFIVELCRFLQDALSVGLGYACISVQNL